MTRYWAGFIFVTLTSFAVLGWVGTRIYQEAPPLPSRVVSTDGAVVFGEDEIQHGQNVWQAMGGMEVGSIWGHGSYVAPDWTADALHRESTGILDAWARGDGAASYDALGRPAKAALRERLIELMRSNTYDASARTIVVAPVRARAIEVVAAHYAEVFSKGNHDYAIPAGAQTDPVKLRQLAAFFWWSSWAASTNRPGDTISYTSNWPHEPLVDNHVSADALVWTGVSIVLLLGGVGALAWWYGSRRKEGLPTEAPASRRMMLTPVHTSASAET